MRRKIAVIGAILVSSLVAFGCSQADTASDNISKEAEQFKIVRSVVVNNDFTDKVLFQAVGRCSIENGDTMPNTVDIICKDMTGIKKHMIVRSKFTSIAITQVYGANVSEFRTKFIFRPTSIVPDIDLVTQATEPTTP